MPILKQQVRLLNLLVYTYFHHGKLQSFSAGVEPEIIEVQADDLHVVFLAWHTIRDGKTRIILQLKQVKRVSLFGSIKVALLR